MATATKSSPAEPAIADPSATDLGHLFLGLHQRMHRLVDEAMTATGISLARAKVLMQLRDRGPMNQTALANCLGYAPRSVTDAVDALVRDDLAARTADPNDRRARIVEITPAGQTVLARAMTAKNAAMEQIFGALDAPARTQFAELMTLIGRSLTSPSGDCFV
jgi:DNA-binding MarR family transcriptional regulator